MNTKQLVTLAAVAMFGAGLTGSVIAADTTTGAGSSSVGAGAGMDAGASAGASTSAGGSGDYTKLDKDQDGMISKKEASKNKDLAKKWDTLDVNKDGKLDQGEFAQFEAAPSSSTSGQ